MKLALIDYDLGNLGSVAKAFTHLGVDIEIIDKPKDLPKFEKAILPGVGNFGDGMESLLQKNWVAPLKEFVNTNRPLLGICLGMQLMLEASEEAPNMPGLGFFSGKVTRFPSDKEKVPQIGWNDINILKKDKLFENLEDNSFFYFVHSYYVPLNTQYSMAKSEYILEFSSVIGRNNLYGVQFHPEKSQNVGLQLLKNFIDKTGE